MTERGDYRGLAEPPLGPSPEPDEPVAPTPAPAFATPPAAASPKRGSAPVAKTPVAETMGKSRATSADSPPVVKAKSKTPAATASISAKGKGKAKAPVAAVRRPRSVTPEDWPSSDLSGSEDDGSVIEVSEREASIASVRSHPTVIKVEPEVEVEVVESESPTRATKRARREDTELEAPDIKRPRLSRKRAAVIPSDDDVDELVSSKQASSQVPAEKPAPSSSTVDWSRVKPNPLISGRVLVKWPGRVSTPSWFFPRSGPCELTRMQCAPCVQGELECRVEPGSWRCEACRGGRGRCLWFGVNSQGVVRGTPSFLSVDGYYSPHFA